MKKIALFIFLALAMLQINAQDYLIDFIGTGASTTVDSVQVRNLTQNTGFTLNGTDVLLLKRHVGIEQEVAHTGSDFRIYPNPMNEAGFIEFGSFSPGIATIEVSDMTGKQLTLAQAEISCGRHTFSISGLMRGIYTVNIKSAGYVYSGKIISTMTGTGNPGINYISSDNGTKTSGKLKSIRSLVPMQFDEGDQLFFKCFSGIYKTVIPLMPVQSQTVTSIFVACTDADSNNYAIVLINTQTWMAENLKVGTRIDGIQDQTDNGVIEKYCYDNDEANCDTYGGLYKWGEMMQYVTTPGVMGICPPGWHIPTDEEWTTLTDFLLGTYDAGGKMKSVGTIKAGTGLWHFPNSGATNESGFTVLPAGCRLGGGNFDYLTTRAHFWSSTEDTPLYAWYRTLYYGSKGVNRESSKSRGLSVRCVQD